MKIQVELNILSDDELKNQWGTDLYGSDLELNQNTYRIGEFIFTFSDLPSSIDLEKIMEQSVQFIKEEYVENRIEFFKVINLDKNKLYCYIIAGTYTELAKTIKKPWKTMMDYPVYLKHHYLIHMKLHNISFDDICVIERQKLLQNPVSKFFMTFISIVIMLIIFNVTYNLVLVGIIFLIETIILCVLERPGGLKIRRN